MEILTGLFDHMVLQRNGRNRSEASITGTASASGRLFARVTSNGEAVKGWGRKQIGEVKRGKLKAVIAGLPTGGPYEIELCVTAGKEAVDQLTVRDVLVGDVWLVGGQSNMQGCGQIQNAARPQPQVRAFNMDDQWRVAKDPIHNMWACVDQVHIELCGGLRPERNTTHGVGPAVAFGQEMQRRTSVPQGLIASAHGGTSMAQWDPSRKKEGGRSLYGAMIRRLMRSGGRTAGMIWYQGESDANPDAAPQYTDRMKGLIRAVRRDTKSPRLPVAVVQISRLVADWPNSEAWNSVQDQERRLQDLVPNVANVPSIDLTLEDLIHLGGSDVNRLGRRLGQAMHAMVGGRGAGKLPIAIKKISSEIERRSGLANIVVEFANVEGKLQSGDRPAGFDLIDENGVPYVFDVRLKKNCAILRTCCTLAGLADKHLHYGRGHNPVCNITDEADRSLPVFGPLPPGSRIRALTPFARALRVTELLPGAGDLRGLGPPQRAKWRQLEFPTDHCDLHMEFGPEAPEDRLVYFSCRLRVPEKMKLAACLGYDGPVKLWIDGKELYHDPNGVNPAVQDEASVPFLGEKGSHKVLVAFGSNRGRGWGIFLRFERLSIPKLKSPDELARYAMPEILPK